MIAYNILFFIFALWAVENRRAARPMFWLACFGLMLFIGLRYEVGADWPGYMAIFEGVRFLSYKAAIGGGDPGFYSVVWLVHRAGYEIWAVNLICAAIFTYGLARFCSRQPNPALAVTVALPVLCIVVAMSATRQSTAIGLLLLALVAFSDGKLLRFLILSALAALFHASALLIVPIAALSYTRNRLQAGVVIAIALAMAAFLVTRQFDIYMTRYSGEDPQAQGAVFRLAMNVIPGAIFLYASRRFRVEEHERVLWRNLSILALLCMPLLVVSASSTALDRIALYIIPLQIFVLSRAPYVFAGKPQHVFPLVMAVIAYSFTILLGFLLLSTHGEYWMPYQFYPLS